jgi:hypothetical protein
MFSGAWKEYAGHPAKHALIWGRMAMKSLMFLATAIAVSASAGLFPQGAKTKPIQGAVQMPGDNGKIGTPYMLGKKNDEFVFTLEKVEFANRALFTNNALYATDKERLAVITYAVQNPGKSDRFFSTSPSASRSFLRMT